ncbi:hypothetical protein E4T43_00130 [Aureobasidium subglaciale]|nr:hypothetical protein E4T43_00130 [Aureobasidium subglaciale]
MFLGSRVGTLASKTAKTLLAYHGSLSKCTTIPLMVPERVISADRMLYIDVVVDLFVTDGLSSRCGHTWFESQEVAGRLDDGSLYRPSCTWLDGNHDGNIENAALKFATYAYGNDTSHVTLDQDACASTLFGAQEDEIIDAPVDPSLAKRSTTSSRTRLPWMENKLVVSNIDSHSAANLCNSETSWGPDFVDSHGKLCDMGTKTLYTLCSNENVDGCVEVSTGSSNGTSNSVSVARQRQ